MDLVIRGLDAQFQRDIASTGCNSVRELLRVRFAKIPEPLRALYEFAIIECREATPALCLSSSGRREEASLCYLRIRSCYAALAVAELVRREFAARLEPEKPQILIVAHGLGLPAETAPQLLTSVVVLRAPTAPAEQPPAASAPASANVYSAGAPLLVRPAGITPPDSGATSSRAPQPPIEPPPVFGAESAGLPLSFSSAKSIAEAAAAAATLIASNEAKRRKEAAQGMPSPRPFSGGAARSLTAWPSSMAPIETPQTGTPSRSFTALLSSAAPVETTQTRASPSRADSSRAAPTGPDTGSAPRMHAHKRRATSPPQSPIAKRSAETGSSAENPMLLDSPEKPAAEPRSRLSVFAYEEERAAGSPLPALVIAESGATAESTASKAAEPASRCPTPHLPPVEVQDLDSPRSPLPPRPAASSSARESSSALCANPAS